MKTLGSSLAWMLLLLLGAAGVAAQTAPSSVLPPGTAVIPAPATADGPRIRFAAQVHDFGRIASGSTVKHDFVFTNTGAATLHISNVVTSCGCTTAGQWSRAVEPGETGNIPVQFSSGSFQGTIFKTVTVQSNDKQQPSALLQLKCAIWKPIEVNPTYAVLQANPETLGQTKASIRVLNHEETPLTLEPPRSLSPAFVVEVRTNEPGRDYELLVTVSDKGPLSSSQGVITMKTSSTNTPDLNVTAVLVVQPVVAVMPPQIHLPAGPWPGTQPFVVSIMNNGTNSLSLSDPQVNAKDVKVEIRETAAGRYFSLAVNFPAGFETEPGQTTELRVKSNHPQFPVLKVPIIQPQRPATPPVAAALPTPPAGPLASPAQAVTAVRPAGRPPVRARPLAATPPLPPMPGDLATNSVAHP